MSKFPCPKGNLIQSNIATSININNDINNNEPF